MPNLGEGVVVADAGATERRHDAKLLQLDQHRLALHGGAVVGVQDQATARDALATAGVLDELRGEVVGLLVVHGPPDHLAAPHVDDRVQEPERAARAGGQVGDVPGPDLVRAGGDVLARATARPRSRSVAVPQQPAAAQQPVHRRLGREVAPLVGELGDELVRRQAAELVRREQRDELGLLRGRQGIAGPPGRATALILEVGARAPALHRARVEADQGTGGSLARAGRDRLIDVRERHLSLFGGVSSSPSPQSRAIFFLAPAAPRSPPAPCPCAPAPARAP